MKLSELTTGTLAVLLLTLPVSFLSADDPAEAKAEETAAGEDAKAEKPLSEEDVASLQKKIAEIRAKEKELARGDDPDAGEDFQLLQQARVRLELRLIAHEEAMLQAKLDSLLAEDKVVESIDVKKALRKLRQKAEDLKLQVYGGEGGEGGENEDPDAPLPDDYVEIIKRLQAENARLKKEIAALKEKLGNGSNQ